MGYVVDIDPEAANSAYHAVQTTYPIYLTRDLNAARDWLRRRARGTERFGLVASSGAQRLRPEGIHVKAEIEPVKWFLNGSMDIRSSYYLEDVASGFAVQVSRLIGLGCVGTAISITTAPSAFTRRSRELSGSR